MFNISLLRPFFHLFVQEGEDKKFLITRLQSIHEQKRDPRRRERSQVCVQLPQEKKGSGKPPNHTSALICTLWWGVRLRLQLGQKSSSVLALQWSVSVRRGEGGAAVRCWHGHGQHEGWRLARGAASAWSWLMTPVFLARKFPTCTQQRLDLINKTHVFTMVLFLLWAKMCFFFSVCPVELQLLRPPQIFFSGHLSLGKNWNNRMKLLGKKQKNLI